MDKIAHLVSELKKCAAEALKRKPESTFSQDFMAGVDPTGKFTFDYGLHNPKERRFRHMAGGVAGGFLGGATVIPSAITATLRGSQAALRARGGIRNRLIAAGRGALEGAIEPVKKIYKSVTVSKALNQGKKLTPGLAKDIEYLAGMSPGGFTKERKLVYKALNRPQALPTKFRKTIEENAAEKGREAAIMLGMGGAINAGAAAVQYRAGSKLRKNMKFDEK